MDFRQAQEEVQRLLEQVRQGAMNAQEFAAAVNRLQVTDSQGRWWQPDPGGQGWLCWDGSQWRPDSPPMTTKPIPEPGPGAGQAFQAGWRRLQADFMAPERFVEVSRRTPWRQRPQSWWDFLAIAGGAASGYLWFVYSSVRGLPRLTFWNLGWESWFDVLPAALLLVLPVLLLASRSPLATLQSWISRWANLSRGAKVAWGLGGLILMVLLQTNNPLFSQREGLDFITPLLMVAIPALLVMFRPQTDALLAPLQSWRRSMPPLVLVGISLAVPFFTAFVLYNGLGISQYPLLRANVVLGTLLSYAILRHPAAPGGVQPPLPNPALLLVLLVVLCSLSPEGAWAHDFLRDPFNLRDGLRTEGIAPVLAGVSTAIVSILVNGVEVAKVMIQDTKPAEEGTEQHKNFVVLVDTLDKNGAVSTTLDQLANDTIFIYAHCEELGKGRFPAGDPTIKFSLTSAMEWVALADLGTQHGQRCARLTFAASLPAGDPPESAGITVSAGAGDLITTKVDITLQTGGFALEVF